MTTAAELVASVRADGADLLVVGGRIRMEGPRGVLTPERRTAIAAHRNEVLAILITEADAAALDRLRATLDGHDPQRTLERGYALVEDDTGDPVTSAASARTLKGMTLRMHDGTVPIAPRESS